MAGPTILMKILGYVGKKDMYDTVVFLGILLVTQYEYMSCITEILQV